MLPAKNRIDNTVQYLMVDALGLDFLTNAFTAQYRDGEAGFTGFVASCKSVDNAAEVLAKYKAHLEEFGDMAEPAKIEGASVCSPRWAAASSTAPGQVETTPASRRSRAATRPPRP